MAIRNRNFGVRLTKEDLLKMKDFVFDNGWFIEGYRYPYNNYE